MQRKSKLHKFIKTIRLSLEEDFTRYIDGIVNKIILLQERNKIKSTYPAYKNKKYFSEAIDSFSKLLKEEAEETTD